MPRQNLTANACTVCRKKRTKCDGRHPCRRCVSRGEECVYEDKMWRTKDHLRSEIEKLRKEVYQSQGLIKALTPQGADDKWKAIQSRLQRGDPPERIAEWINSLRSPHPNICSHPTVSPEIAGASLTDTSPSGTMSPSDTRGSSSSLRCSSSYPRSMHTSDSTASSRAQSWTQVTTDTEAIHRLLYHYFDRCFPDFSYICKERFMRDFNEGTELYCSPALLNAILGFAAQSHDVVPSTGNQPCASNQFLCEARRLLEEEEGDMDITGIQATGVLAMAEVNLGNDELAYQLSIQCARNTILLRIRMDSEGHDDAMDDQNYRKAMATTFCGAFSMVRIFRLLTGRLSTQTGPLFMRLADRPQEGAEETPEARVERGVALQQHFINQLDYCPEPMRLLYTATEIAHTFCSYHHDGGVTPADLMPAYNKCLLAWERFSTWLPSGNETNKETVFAQIWYNYILLVLFNALVDFPVDLRQGTTPKAVVVQASQSIIYLTGVYQDYCTFESIHPLFSHMVFAATLFQLRRSFDKMGDRNQRLAHKTSDKRKRFSEPHTPSSVHTPNAISPLIERRRQSAVGQDIERLTFPPLESHVAAATLRHIVDPKDVEASILWSSKSSFQLAEHGTQLLTQMGAQSPKAAELASVLRVRSMAGPKTTGMSGLSFAKPMMPTAPQWPSSVPNSMTGWTSAPRPEFPKLGMSSLQSFAAMTSNNVPSIGVDDISPAGILDDGSLSISESEDVTSYFDVPDVYPDPSQQPGSGSGYSGYSSGVSPVGMMISDGGQRSSYASETVADLC